MKTKIQKTLSNRKIRDTRYAIRNTQQKGFTLLLAAIVASIVLSIGAAIFAIALKQVTLASTGKNSQYAFYAADTASECALYWDVQAQAFATSSESINNSLYLNEITCDAETITGSTLTNPTYLVISHNASAATTTFQYEPDGRCAQVYVAKSRNSSGIVTRVHADGYSTACDRITTDPQALQRSVELHY